MCLRELLHGDRCVEYLIVWKESTRVESQDKQEAQLPQAQLFLETNVNGNK